MDPRVEHGEELTFPLRPGKKRILVRKSVEEEEKNSNKDSEKDDERNHRVTSKKGKKVFVSRGVDPSSLVLDEKSQMIRSSQFSQYGALSPLSAEPSKFSLRKDQSGNIIPYSILGNVEDFRRLAGEDNEETSIQLRKSRASSRGVRSPTRSVVSVEDQADYLESVKKIAHEETRRRAAAAEKSLLEEREERMNSMLIHEKLTFGKQERALESYEKWQEEWTRFKSMMCTVSGKTEDQLVLSRAERFRKRIEEYQLISMATPHHQKHGSEYWQMSLRGMGTRYVAVGNIFSGLFCPVRETSNIELETLRFPYAGRSSPWEEPKTLQQRKRQLAGGLTKHRPHLPSTEDVESLVITGEPLLEWAYLSVEKRALETAQNNLDIEGTCAAEEEETIATDSPAMLENSKGPNLELCYRDQHEWAQVEGVDTYSFACSVGEKASTTVTVSNTGTTAVYFQWMRPTEQLAHSFSCSMQKGVLLPSQSLQFVLSFSAVGPGLWTETWRLQTTPSIPSKPDGFEIRIRGLALEKDTSVLDRLELHDELEVAEAEYEAEKRQQEHARQETLKTPNSPTEEEMKQLFEKVNGPLALFYHREEIDKLIALAKEVFTLLHSCETLLDGEQGLQKMIQADLEAWLAWPSLATLKERVLQIRDGEPLRPVYRAPTVKSHDAYSQDGLSQVELEGEDGMSVHLLHESEESETDEDEDSCGQNDRDNPTSTEEEHDELQEQQGEEEKPVAEHKTVEQKQRYITAEQARLDSLGASLLSRLDDLAKRFVKRPEQESRYWSLASACVQAIVDGIASHLDERALAETKQEEQPPSDSRTDAKKASSETKEENAVSAETACQTIFSDAIQRFEESCEDLDKRLLEQATMRLRISDLDAPWALASSFEDDTQNLREKLFQKRVLVFADVDIPPAEDDLAGLDPAIASQKLEPLAELVDWVAKQGPKAILLIGERKETTSRDAASLQPVCENLSSKLGRDIVFCDNLQDEETTGSLAALYASSQDSQEIAKADKTQKKTKSDPKKGAAPVAIDVDEIPVFFLEAESLIPPVQTNSPTEEEKEDEVEDDEEEEEEEAEEEITLPKTRSQLLREFVQVVVHNSSYSLCQEKHLECLSTLAPLWEQIIAGPRLEKDIRALNTLLRSGHCFFIGGMPVPYEDKQDEARESARERDDSDEAEEELSSCATSVSSSSTLSEGSQGDEAMNSHPDVEREETQTDPGTLVDDEEDDDDEEEEDREEGEKSSSNEPAESLPQGFSTQLDMVQGILKLGLAKTLVLFDPVASKFKQALLAMGEGSQRLVDNLMTEDTLVIPEKENLIHTHFKIDSYKSAEMERMRNLFHQARSQGVTVLFLCNDGLSETKAVRKYVRSTLARIPTAARSSFFFMEPLSDPYATRIALREIGKLAASVGGDIGCSSLHVMSQVEYLLDGSAEDEIEQELAEEEEERELAKQDNEEEEDEDEQGEDEISNKNDKTTESEEQTPDPASFGLNSITLLSSQEVLRAVFRDQPLPDLNAIVSVQPQPSTSSIEEP